MRDDEPEPDGWQGKLRASGYRLTPQRQLVLEAVESLGHATPEDVLQHVQKRSRAVNASTVYRTLDVLERTGLVKHAHLGHGAPTYHPAEDTDHLHLVCRDCGGVEEAQVSVADDLVGRLAALHGFDTDVRHFAIYGRCARCSARPTSADS